MFSRHAHAHRYLAAGAVLALLAACAPKVEKPMPNGTAYMPPQAPAADPMVRATQTELIRLGFLRDTADGVLGPRTRAAIQGYQQANGIPADGQPSQRLLGRLKATTTAAATPAWVAPVGTAPAAPAGWVAPVGTAAPPAAPAAPAGWVTPGRPE